MPENIFWISQRTVHAITTLVVCGAALRSASAAFSDNFNSASDADLTHYDPLGQHGYANPGTWSFPGRNTYEIAAGVSAAPAQVGPSRAGSLRLDQTFGNFTESTDIVGWNTGSSSHDESIGLLARVSNPGLGTTDAYSLTYSTGGHDLVLTRITNESPLTIPLGRETIGPPYLAEGGDYRLVFTGTGSQLTGQLYNEIEPGFPILLATVSATDSIYTTGYAGLIVFDNTDTSSGSNGADATFDNFTAVPEPSGVLFLAFGAVALMRRRLISVSPNRRQL